MKTDVIAVLSLCLNMTKDKLMQAAGRLRQFGRDQRIVICSTEEIISSIRNYKQNMNVEEKAETIIDWTCTNSINDNLKMLDPNSKLAWIHLSNKYSQQKVFVQDADLELRHMYQSKALKETVAIINKKKAEILK